jgi:hypothetical protein
MPIGIAKPMTRHEELKSLKSQVKYFEDALRVIKLRLRELKTTEPGKEKSG